MLPINLLPNYIFDKNKKRNALIAYGVAIAAVAALFIVWSQGVQAKLNEQKDRLATANERKTKYDATDKQIKDVQGKIALTKTKQTFIANAQTWNDAWATEYDTIRNLTSQYVLLKSMSILPDRKTVSLTGFAANELLIAKWWIALKNHKEIFENVTIQLPTHPYVPQGAGNNANGGMGAFAGMGGMPGSGGMGGGAGRPMMSGMAGMGGVSGMPGSGGMGMKGGMPGFGGGTGGANSAAVGPAMIEDRPGINFVVTATLKTPLAGAVPGVPVWPANGAAPTGGMGGPGFPGASGMPGSGGMGGSGGMMGGGKMGKGGAD
jgi:hypothetical protein